MSDKKSDIEKPMQFLEEDAGPETSDGKKSVWRVLIIDDEKDVHSATTFALRNTEVVGRPLEFLHASSAREAQDFLETQKDIAVILLDVVMETPNAGLDLVPFIRNQLKIKDTRIILRTGQPNQAPEIEVIRDYDINDYKLKSELTQSRLYASLTTAIRSYKQIQTIETGKRSLSMIVKSSSELLTQKGINEFAQGVILHLSGLLSISPEGLICARRSGEASNAHIIAAAGHFEPLMDRPLSELSESETQKALLECLNSRKNVFNKYGIALYLGSEDRGDMACFVSSEAEFDEIDESLLELFCGNITICADNLELVAQLSEYAYHDDLTGLPNRNSLVNTIDASRGDENSAETILCMLALEHFDEINKSLGQAYVDLLLKSVAARLLEFFPSPVTVSCLNNDNFGMFGSVAFVTKEKLEEAFAAPFEIEGHEQFVSFTAGMVPISEVHGDGDAAVKDASIVLRSAQHNKPGEVLLFRHEMVTDAEGRLGLLRHLRTAFELQQLYLVFQPKIRLDNMGIMGFESLVRWCDGNGCSISPQSFIPLAEQSGLIVRLGEWIILESINSLIELHAQGWKDCDVSVNLSLAQLQHPGFVDFLASAVERMSFDPKYINLEINESFATSNIDSTISLLKDIKALGYTISLDDFGAQYSSLIHLQKMPLDYIKLDRSLLEKIQEESGKQIIEIVLHAADKLGIEVVAECVEQEAELGFLKSINCGHAQGFYFAQPMQKDELQVWLEDKSN